MPCPICQREHDYAPPQALAALAGTPRRLRALARRVSPARAAARPAPDKWSTKEIICHLADCEWVFGIRYRKIAAEPGAVLPAFDQEAWAARLDYAKIPLKSALATFEALRGANVALLRSLPAEAWGQTGEHPSYGPLQLNHLILHLADHDAAHLRRLEELCPVPARKSRAKAKPRTRRKRGRK